MKIYYKNFVNIVLSILLAFIIIAMSIVFVLAFKPLYYYDISNLSIEKTTNLTKNNMIKNYDYTVNYLLSSKNNKFNLPTLPSSPTAKIHFYEVKKIFSKLITLLITSIATFSIISLFYKFDLCILKWSAINLLLAFLSISIPSLADFNKFFNLFHGILFNNLYWKFDPEQDPIITMLPEKFFFHCAFIILSIWIISSVILATIYNSKRKA